MGNRGQLRRKERNSEQFTGMSQIAPKESEFLCPVCRRVANCILPIVAHGDGAPQ